jgi:hypothetical protein
VPATLTGDPFAKSFRLLVPSAPLAPGPGYTLKVKETCSGGGLTTSTSTLERTFDVGPIATLPSTIGTLTTTPGGAIDVKLSPEMVAFLPTAALSLLVTGGDKATGDYGYGAVTADTIHTAVYPCMFTYETVIKVSATLRAHIAGATSDPPPVTQDFNVICPSRGWEADPVGPMPSDPADAGKRNDMNPPNDPSPQGCGCRMAGEPDRSDSRAGLVASVALASLLSRRGQRGKARAKASSGAATVPPLPKPRASKASASPSSVTRR